MGGEPLLRWPLIKKLVLFAVRRAKEHQKTLKVSMTMNCTLISDEIIEFANVWNIQFLSSFDGIEEVQNNSRPLKGGRDSFAIVEKAVLKMLTYDPHLGTRATILSKDAAKIFESYLYSRKLGYINIAMLPANREQWARTDLSIFKEQLFLIAADIADNFRLGREVLFHGINDHFRNILLEKPVARPTCGAGRGMVIIDIDGNIWSCSRFTGHKRQVYCRSVVFIEISLKKKDMNPIHKTQS